MKRDEVAALAQNVLDLRSARGQHLPSVLFNDHAWDLLLVLFISDADGERVNVKEACKRAGIRSSVGERWTKALRELGLVTCEVACDDNHLVTLTPIGVHGVEACMEDTFNRRVVPLVS